MLDSMVTCSYLASVQNCWPVAVQVSTEVVTRITCVTQTQLQQSCLCPSFEKAGAQEEDKIIVHCSTFTCIPKGARPCKKNQNLRVVSVAGLSPLDQGQDPGPEVQGAAEAIAEAAAGLVAEMTETGIEDAILAETMADQASHLNSAPCKCLCLALKPGCLLSHVLLHTPVCHVSREAL